MPSWFGFYIHHNKPLLNRESKISERMKRMINWRWIKNESINWIERRIEKKNILFSREKRIWTQFFCLISFHLWKWNWFICIHIILYSFDDWSWLNINWRVNFWVDVRIELEFSCKLPSLNHIWFDRLC